MILEYNMDKIMEFWYSKDEKEIEKYKYFIMLDLEPEDLKILSKKDKLVEEYKMDVEIINRDVRFREYMSEEEDRRKCYNSDISIAKKEGMKEANMETAKSLLKLGINTLEQIAECTNLSLEEIKSIKTKELE